MVLRLLSGNGYAARLQDDRLDDESLDTTGGLGRATENVNCGYASFRILRRRTHESGARDLCDESATGFALSELVVDVLVRRLDAGDRLGRDLRNLPLSYSFRMFRALSTPMLGSLTV